MSARVASRIAVCCVLGLAACGSSSTSKGLTTLASFPKTTVFAILPTTTPSTTAAPPVTDSAGAVVTQPPPTAPAGTSTYTVVSGDYLVKIAKKFSCSINDIIAANNFTGDPSAFPLNPGSPINLPATCKESTTATTTTAAKGTGKTTTTTTAKGATTTTAAKGATTVPTTAAAGTTYTIVANDTLSGIGKKFGTTAQAIASANGWSDGTSHHINPGDVIKLPAKKA